MGTGVMPISAVNRNVVPIKREKRERLYPADSPGPLRKPVLDGEEGGELQQTIPNSGADSKDFLRYLIA